MGLQTNKFFNNSFSRMFLLQNRARPNAAPLFQGLWRAGALSWSQGDVTLVYVPDPSAYDAFQVVGKIVGQPGVPELPIMARYTQDRSRLLKLAPNGCDHDLQIHIGDCKNPQDFNAGWNKVVVLEGARITSYRTGELGALDPGERTVVNEEVPWSGETAYEITKLAFANKAANEVTTEVMAITVCDAVSCGLCGLPSDGCQTVFAVEKSSGASPGLVARLLFTTDGGATWAFDNITSGAATEDPTDVKCVGSNIVVVTGTAAAGLHYKAITDVLNGVVGGWTKVTSGFSTGLPRKIYSASPSETWLVATAGYIYKTTDPTSLVTVQDAGAATAQQLNAIHGIDNLKIVAVGNSNAVVYTLNGGVTWQSVTGPAPAVNLNTVFMVDSDTWFVGTAGGALYYTNNSGLTWTIKAFPGSSAGVIRDITFTTPTVGFMSHDTAAAVGRILRTIDGGFSWYVLPEQGLGSLPTNQRITDLATCADPNIVFGGGLGTGTDGIIVLGA